MKAKCISLRYEAGDFYLTQGVKQGTKTTYKNGYIHSSRGSGWGDNYKPSHLVLYLDVDGRRGYSWVDRYFKDNIGKLTENRRNKIQDAMPAMVEVEEYTRQDGVVYYVVSDKDMAAWVNRSGL
ncbi:hypothetical protein [Clostridium sp.]|uniref:hypothetical protein n=1 Tax=Clostridium sp. TaxID=1506 RepID=UPI00321672DC